MSPPRKWRIAGPIELDPTEMETLTPRQAGRAEFKERQHLYENMIRERHPGGTWELGFRSGKQEKPKGFARREARLAEGNVKRGKAPDVVAAPRSSKARNVEGALEGSAVMETAPVVPLLGEMSFLRVEEDGPREVNIAELVRPQRNTRTRGQSAFRSRMAGRPLTSMGLFLQSVSGDQRPSRS